MRRLGGLHFTHQICLKVLNIVFSPKKFICKEEIHSIYIQNLSIFPFFIFLYRGFHLKEMYRLNVYGHLALLIKQKFVSLQFKYITSYMYKCILKYQYMYMTSCTRYTILNTPPPLPGNLAPFCVYHDCNLFCIWIHLLFRVYDLLLDTLHMFTSTCKFHSFRSALLPETNLELIFNQNQYLNNLVIYTVLLCFLHKNDKKKFQ